MQQRSLSVFASVATSLWSSDASELERKLRPQAQYTASRAPTKEERNSNLISHLQNSRDVWRVRILFRDYGDIFRSCKSILTYGFSTEMHSMQRVESCWSQPAIIYTINWDFGGARVSE